ncbi:serine hydroxymethyltransferase [Legionella wadsworthii]|uniref:Serine hydroxymethyltransferase n=1 Tax=Legionella wadsworthii TaxID=28088 RepID=A0A378LV02_9GAMM|nr:aminotransferase class I/II-fold pyridoxal phosphate-dependent enzyme [Legionella wadsworthii]STY29659.1 serine hydroxymethyltransferase [Legionella wadsworthii]
MFITDWAIDDSALLHRSRREFMHCQSYAEMQDMLMYLIKKNGSWRKQCINLVAAESPMSQIVRSLLADDLSMRTASGYIGKKNRYFMATQYIDQFESLCHVLLTDLFECNYCDHRLMGGTQACQVVYSTLTQPNDTLITVMPMHGGDSSNCRQSMPGLLNLNIVPMPFLRDNLTIDLHQLEYLLDRYKPKLISLGFSICLLEQPIRAISALCQKFKVPVFYDASHELGLIAGKCFANPFIQGTTIVSGSTGKTFSGPQGGLLLWNDDYLVQPITNTVFPNFVGTYQLNRVAALTLASLEIQQYGEEYMAQGVRNAKTLAMQLHTLGISVFAQEKNYTQTHQILIDATKYGGGFAAANRLEACHIITNHVNLPGDKEGFRGIRIATTEMTRRGMKEKHMQEIVHLVYRALETSEPASSIAKGASILSQEFQKIHYC